jgi:hypothetical protein
VTDRNSLLSSASVGVAIIGSAIGDQLLSLAGPVLALLVHIWTQQREKRDYRKLRFRLDFAEASNLALKRKLYLATKELEHYRQPVSPVITPPFPPGEACSDA